MTRKDYQLIANAIAKEHRDAHLIGAGEGVAKLALAYLARRLANDLKQTNPRFDRDRFYNACFPK